MKLYHGSNCEIEHIDLSLSKPNKDFGKGFYLSPTRMQAKEMALAKTAQLLYGEPTITTFEFDESRLGELKVLTFSGYSRDWAEFILKNRKNPLSTPAHDYDIVIGPIANDRVGLQLWRYEKQDIDIDTLVQKLKYMKGVTTQYFFGTDKAIKLLKKI